MKLQPVAVMATSITVTIHLALLLIVIFVFFADANTVQAAPVGNGVTVPESSSSLVTGEGKVVDKEISRIWGSEGGGLFKAEGGLGEEGLNGFLSHPLEVVRGGRGKEGEDGCGCPPHSSPAVPSEPNEPSGTTGTPAETLAAGGPVVAPPPPTEVPAAGDAPQ